MSHGFYLGWAYAVTGIAIVVELAWLAARRARALRAIEEERDLEAQD